MNRTEFGKWVAHHGAAFPDWYRWLESTETSSETFETYFRAMSDSSLAGCQQATDEMLRGTLSRPFNNSDHVTAIRSRARDLDYLAAETARDEVEVRYVDNERVYKCALCEDGGYVRVCRPETIRRAKRGEYDGLIEYFDAMHEIADRIVTEQAGKPFSMADTYNRSRQLVEEANVRRPPIRKPPGYVVVFCGACEVGRRRKRDEEKTIEEKPSSNIPPTVNKAYDPDRMVIAKTFESEADTLRRAKSFTIENSDLSAAINEFEFGGN